MINFYYVKKFCKDDISLIENYDKAIVDKEQTWQCHHRKGTIVSKKELIENNEYYNRPACELIFLTKTEHSSLHGKSRFHTEEAKRHMSEAMKGKNKGKTPWNKGKHDRLGVYHNEEAKQKMSAAKVGMRFFNNGIITVRAKSCPEGFVRGMLKHKTKVA